MISISKTNNAREACCLKRVMSGRWINERCKWQSIKPNGRSNREYTHTLFYKWQYCNWMSHFFNIKWNALLLPRSTPLLVHKLNRIKNNTWGQHVSKNPPPLPRAYTSFFLYSCVLMYLQANNRTISDWILIWIPQM